MNFPPRRPPLCWRGDRFSCTPLRYFLADQLRQTWDLSRTCQAVQQVFPERHLQFPARFLQGCKRVSAATPQVTPRSGADLPDTHLLPDVALTYVVMQRHFRPLQHPQEIVLLLVDTT